MFDAEASDPSAGLLRFARNDVNCLIEVIHLSCRVAMAPAAADESVAALRPPRPVTTWMPGATPGMTQMASVVLSR